MLAGLATATVRAPLRLGALRAEGAESLGGAEADPVTQLEVLEALTHIDASGRLVPHGRHHRGGPARGLPPTRAIGKILAGGRVPPAAVAILPTGTATPVDGGYRLTGRWPFASGVRHAEWLTAGAMVRRDAQDPGERHIVVIPAAAAEIHDNWQVAGLEGTGSSDSPSPIARARRFRLESRQRDAAPGGALFRLASPPSWPTSTWPSRWA